MDEGQLMHRKFVRCLAAAAATAVVIATGPAASAQPAAPAAPTSPATFTHPGVLVSRAQLDTMRQRVQAGTQPQKQAYDSMMGSKYASLSYTPHPRAVVDCGPSSMPNNGCTDEREDAIAAYTQSLAWYVTGDARYANKAIQIMDAWSATIKDHTSDNAHLQTAWSASTWPRAAEIIKYAYGTWLNSGRFATMLRNVYYNEIQGSDGRTGNWELSIAEAIVGIGVFLEDKTIYDRGMSIYRNRVPAFIYLSSDGALPKTVPGSGLNTRDQIVGYWQGQSTFVDGLTQETCRDFVHTGYGIAAIAEVAETSRIQGQDLYGTDIGERLRQALGFQTKYELTAAPSWLCGGTVKRGLGPVTEVGYNALHNRLGIAMTNTQAYTTSHRPQGSNNLFVSWETLTHGDNPA
ncbi:alginate lyase family protein [Amycolatopsis sp. NPDC005232]|uniref:alginate lyase family protein n=1 Tax=Amycolatopsis sp. NPDC005232 TaxID=3157027 RepID=UPI0033AA6466